MSSYVITTDPLHVRVGWDRPLQTFFLIITDQKEKTESRRVKAWLGGDPNEIETIEDLESELADFGGITGNVMLDEDTRVRLAADQALSSRPTTVQRKNIQAVTGKDVRYWRDPKGDDR